MQRDWWQEFISSDSCNSVELKRKQLVFIFFSFVGTAFSFLFGFNAHTTNSSILELTLFSCGCIFAINLFALKFHHNNQLAFNVCAFNCIPLLLVIVATGGYQNTGLYWIYAFPLAFFILFGYAGGALANTIAFIGILILLFNIDSIPADYRPAEISRFIVAYLVNIILCFIAEYFRFKSTEELKSINFDKERQANTDALTKLPNRRFIDSLFRNTLDQSTLSQFPMAVMVADLDRFKQVNDTYGHDIGDKVLVHIAKLFRECTREGDIVSRTGGEEFLLLFPKTDIVTSVKVAEKLRNCIEKNQLDIDSGTLNVTISIGIANISHPQQLEQAIKDADILLYLAKDKGRNRTEVAS